MPTSDPYEYVEKKLEQLKRLYKSKKGLCRTINRFVVRSQNRLENELKKPEPREALVTHLRSMLDAWQSAYADCCGDVEAIDDTEAEKVEAEVLGSKILGVVMIIAFVVFILFYEWKRRR